MNSQTSWTLNWIIWFSSELIEFEKSNFQSNLKNYCNDSKHNAWIFCYCRQHEECSNTRGKHRGETWMHRKGSNKRRASHASIYDDLTMHSVTGKERRKYAGCINDRGTRHARPCKLDLDFPPTRQTCIIVKHFPAWHFIVHSIRVKFREISSRYLNASYLVVDEVATRISYLKLKITWFLDRILTIKWIPLISVYFFTELLRFIFSLRNYLFRKSMNWVNIYCFNFNKIIGFAK